MAATLLEQFIAEECTPHVRGLLAAALTGDAPAHARFEFNRFELAIDRDAGVAIVNDILDVTEAGEQRVSLASLVAALARSAGGER
jgi:hypothetical protein